MNPDNILERHGEEAIRVVLAQILPAGERQTAEIVQRPNPGRVHTGVTQAVAVEGYILVSPVQGRLQSFQLNLGQFIPILTLHFFIPDQHL
jgi:hypothetical protein